jgi:hypothetical protein
MPTSSIWPLPLTFSDQNFSFKSDFPMHVILFDYLLSSVRLFRLIVRVIFSRYEHAHMHGTWSISRQLCFSTKRRRNEDYRDIDYVYTFRFVIRAPWIFKSSCPQDCIRSTQVGSRVEKPKRVLWFYGRILWLRCKEDFERRFKWNHRKRSSSSIIICGYILQILLVTARNRPRQRSRQHNRHKRISSIRRCP